MTSSLGLPRYVLTFLRHMESHKDYLKWNISESSHKITLTLTWNFRKTSKALSLSDNLLDKLQRTLNIGRSPPAPPINPESNRKESTSVPQDLTKFLEATPKKHKRTRLKRRLSLTMGAIRRTLSTGSSHSSSVKQNSINRSSSLGVLPHHNQSNHTSATSSLAKIPRHNSFHACNTGIGCGTRMLSPVQTTTFNESPERSSYSWTGGSFNISRGSTFFNSQSADELDASGSQALLDTATGSSCYSDSPQRPRRLKLTYRSEDELEESLEDIMEKTRSETQAKLDIIRKEWNETTREWPKIITAESRGGKNFVKISSSGYANPPPSLSSTFVGNASSTCDHGSSSDASQTPPPPPESPDNLKQLQGETIGKCLDSCDKILMRYETDIT